jgi:hypothetical protein
MLILFSSFLFLKLKNWEVIDTFLNRLSMKERFNKINEDRVFLLTAAAVVGGNYFHSAVAKVRLRWMFRDSLYYYIPFGHWEMYENLTADTVLQLYELAQFLNPLMLWGAFIIQLAGIVLLWRRDVFFVTIAGFITFHTFVFFIAGIFFWKWILLLLGFVVYVEVTDRRSEIIFTKRAMIIVVILIVLSPMVLQATSFSWYDSNYDSQYSVELVDEDGNVYEVHWSEMDHYYYHFGSDRFDYIYNGKVISASKNYQIILALEAVQNESEVSEIIGRHGTNKFDAKKADDFDQFIRNYFASYQKEHTDIFWSKIPSPPHFWTLTQTDLPPKNQNYTHAQVRRTERIVIDGEMKTVNSEVIRRIPLD